MQILNDTLEPLVEEWSDPGDYPNAVAQSPLSSYEYLAGMEGELELQLTNEELAEMHEIIEAESIDFWVTEIVDYDLPSGVQSADWKMHIIGNVVTLTAEEVEADPDYNPNEDTRW